MNTHDTIQVKDSPETLRGCLWAVVVFGTLLVAWQTGLVGVVTLRLHARSESLRQAQQAHASLIADTEKARKAQEETIAQLGKRLDSAESSRNEAIHKLVAAEQGKERAEEELARDRSKFQAPPASPPLASPQIEREAPPSETDILSFIRSHLSRMAANDLAAQMADYAEVVDFHNKGAATPRTVIAAERNGWTQKWPSREIQLDNSPAQIITSADAGQGLQITVAFTWRWAFRNQAGTLVRGMSRDVWRIVPAQGGFKIIAEHSIDPITGRPTD